MFETISYWHWWSLALVLVALEAFLPGVAFAWLAVGAVVVGGLVAVLPDTPLYVQGIVFAVVAGLVILVARRFVKSRFGNERAADGLNERGASLKGQTAVLIEPIVNGTGRARVGDSSWTVVGPDQPAGARVRIVDLNGNQLVVTPEG
ncbi:NfeD family protein [Zavarzinia sp. CC-PAN008]|uniref:NfeD family protein n=1 Tax=Zavarzinia sp. CC-PAN008 TaxID=3243332 RepID=UPI003F74894E